MNRVRNPLWDQDRKTAKTLMRESRGRDCGGKADTESVTVNLEKRMPYANVDDRRKNQRELRRKRRQEFFVDKSCSHCGTKDRLQLHHIDPATKIESWIWHWSSICNCAGLLPQINHTFINDPVGVHSVIYVVKIGYLN